MSVGAAPRDPARRRQWGDAARRRRHRRRRDPARGRAWGGGADLVGRGLGGRWGGARSITPALHFRFPPRGYAVRPHPQGRWGHVCAARGLNGTGRVWATSGWGRAVTPGPHLSLGGPPYGRTHKPASGAGTASGGRGSFCRRGQSGAGGVRTGPMAAREGALLGDRVMGRPQRCAGRGGRARSLTQPGAHWPGLLPVTAAGDWSSLPGRPTSRGRRGKPGGHLPSQAGIEWAHRRLPGAGRREWRGHLASGLCTDIAWCDSNKGASLDRGTRARTWPLAPTRAYAHRRRLSSASRLTGAPSLVILLKRLWNLQLPAPLLTGASGSCTVEGRAGQEKGRAWSSHSGAAVLNNLSAGCLFPFLI